MLRNHRLCVVCAITAALLLLLVSGERLRAADKPISFINDVAPILKENCFACHDAKKRSGKYDMTTIEKMLAGGSDVEPITAGKPDESDFYTLMMTNEERRMPPREKGEAVPKEKADIIRLWIAQGAKIDSGLSPKADLVKELRVRWAPPSPPAKYAFPTIVNALAFTPDNKQLVVGGHHELTVWTVADAKLVKRIATRAERAYGLAFLPSGQLVVAGGRPGQEGDVRVYNLNAKPKATTDGVAILDGVNDKAVLVHHLLDADDSILCVAVSADGKRLVAGGCDRAVRVWDISGGITTAKLEQTVENHADWVLGAALSADGKLLLTAGRDKTAKVWDLKAKESVMTFPDHQNIVYSVVAKADGTAGFSVGADKQLRSWKAAGDGKQIKAIGGHGDDVFKIVAHPTKPLLLTASADKTVRSWDAEKLQSLKTFQGLSDFAYALTISPDGSLVAGGSYAGEVTVWKIDDAMVVKSFNASPGYVAKTAAPPAK